MSKVYYTDEHEWLRVEGDVATVGITNHAQEQLGDLVFVELPDVGTTLEQGDDGAPRGRLGVVEEALKGHSTHVLPGLWPVHAGAVVAELLQQVRFGRFS